MLRKIKGRYVSLVAVSSAFVASAKAQATVPTEIQDIVTNATSLFGDVKTFVIGVVVFVILIGIVKMIRKK